MSFLYENKKEIRFGNTFKYRCSTKISEKLPRRKKSYIPTLFEGFFDYLNRNPQTVISLINLAIAFVTLASWIIQLLIILCK
jgi:hypothetical protein